MSARTEAVPDWNRRKLIRKVPQNGGIVKTVSQWRTGRRLPTKADGEVAGRRRFEAVGFY